MAPEMTDDSAPAANAGKQRRAGRLCILWGVAFLILVCVALFCRLVIVPVGEVRSAAETIRRTSDQTRQYGVEDAQKAVSSLGGPAAAVRKISLYLRVPRRFAPNAEYAAWMLMACSQDAFPVALRALKHDDRMVRWTATQVLAYIGKERAVDPLIETLADPHPDVRVAAALALGNIGDLRAEQPLIAVLKDNRQDDGVRWAAALALGTLAGHKCEEALVAALNDRRAYVRRGASKGLYRMAPELIDREGTADALARRLTDSDSEVRENAAEALSRIETLSGSAIYELFIEALRDHNRNVRKYAAIALGTNARDAQDAIPFLERRLNDKDSEVRYFVAEALKKIKNAGKKAAP
jgi:HEAT repeats/HEAT repeat